MTRLMTTSMSTPTVCGTAMPTTMDTTMRMAMLMATTMSICMQRDPITATRMLMDLIMRTIMSTAMNWSPSRHAFWPRTMRLPPRTGLGWPDREILALNLVSSPGAGKTTLLERTIRDLRDELPLFVVEGDQATANDGERIRAAGAPVVQVNTGTGCHLEADMVARGLMLLKPGPGSLVVIENVGNLVCPAMFDLGERAKVAILSVTEGDDKPLKYPHIFRASQLMILNKIDLLPHVEFDVERAIGNARMVNPDIEVLTVSARTGEGLDAWYGWLRAQHMAVREATFA